MFQARNLHAHYMDKSLLERLERIESMLEVLGNLDTQRSKTEKIDDSKVMALYSIVQDLAAHLGISSEDFLRHYKARFRWWHDYYLREAEKLDPGVAATLDSRDVGQVCTAESYPFLFDPPPPEI